jgi:hypothetical protein
MQPCVVQLKELCSEMGPLACYALIFAAPLLNRKKEEHVETMIKGSDDCLLSARGCFRKDGHWRLDKHVSAAVLQALALEEDLSRCGLCYAQIWSINQLGTSQLVMIQHMLSMVF